MYIYVHVHIYYYHSPFSLSPIKQNSLEKSPPPSTSSSEKSPPTTDEHKKTTEGGEGEGGQQQDSSAPADGNTDAKQVRERGCLKESGGYILMCFCSFF